MRNWSAGQTIPLVKGSELATGPVLISRTGAYAGVVSSLELDSRFGSTGNFALFTGIGDAWWWMTP